MDCALRNNLAVFVLTILKNVNYNLIILMVRAGAGLVTNLWDSNITINNNITIKLSQGTLI